MWLGCDRRGYGPKKERRAAGTPVATCDLTHRRGRMRYALEAAAFWSKTLVQSLLVQYLKLQANYSTLFRPQKASAAMISPPLDDFR